MSAWLNSYLSLQSCTHFSDGTGIGFLVDRGEQLRITGRSPSVSGTTTSNSPETFRRDRSERNGVVRTAESRSDVFHPIQLFRHQNLLTFS